MRGVVRVWCRSCRTVVDKPGDNVCPECGGSVATEVSPYLERKQRAALVASRWSSNLNGQAAHAEKYG